MVSHLQVWVAEYGAIEGERNSDICIDPFITLAAVKCGRNVLYYTCILPQYHLVLPPWSSIMETIIKMSALWTSQQKDEQNYSGQTKYSEYILGSNI